MNNFLEHSDVLYNNYKNNGRLRASGKDEKKLIIHELSENQTVTIQFFVDRANNELKIQVS